MRERASIDKSCRWFCQYFVSVKGNIVKKESGLTAPLAWLAVGSRRKASEAAFAIKPAVTKVLCEKLFP